MLGEQAPKVWAIRVPEQAAVFIAHPLRWFNIIFGVVIRFLDWLTDIVLALFGIGGSSGHHGPPTLEELRLMIQSSAAGGVIEHDEQRLLINAFDFGSRSAYQVMVPRTETATIGETATIREFLDLFRETGHTRFPVLGERGVDDVRGILSAKDLLIALADGALSYDQPVTPMVRPAFFAPDSNHVSDLLHSMQREHVHIDATNDRLGLELPSGEYETIAGLILDRMGHLPQVGEQVHLDSLNLKVLEMQGPRIARVEITRL